MAKQRFPGWRYGPDGEAKIFNSEEEVPDGWARSPSEVGSPPAKSNGSGVEMTDGLKEEYTMVTGKEPGKKQAKTLQAEIDKAREEHDQFFADNDTSPEEVRQMLSEIEGIELPEEGHIAQLIVLAQEHLVDDDG